jgi:hypothetical protein
MNRFLLRGILTVVCWTLAQPAQSKTKEPEVEIKCLVAEENIATISQTIGLRSKKPIRRVVCFFDTDSLSLFQHTPRLILRARYDSTGESDTTVKVRDGEAQGEDVECEFDEVLGKEKVMSCSLTEKGQETARIKRANRGRTIKKIFSKQQRTMFEKAFGKLEWGTLRPYGPVKGIKVWKKIKMPDGPDLTVEQWELPERPNKAARRLFEVSTKVSLTQERETVEWLTRLLRSGQNGDQESETKTRIVLEHFRGGRGVGVMECWCLPLLHHPNTPVPPWFTRRRCRFLRANTG